MTNYKKKYIKYKQKYLILKNQFGNSYDTDNDSYYEEEDYDEKN